MHLGVLSRGYRRKTFGHLLVNENHSSLDIGDEPKQMKMKFPEIPFAVNKNRSIGIPKLLKDHPEIQLILLDDAFQHFEVRPYLNILLTEYSNPYSKDYLLPSGRLREWRFGHQRAQIVIVTKCPKQPELDEINEWRKELKLLKSQSLFFSTIKYGTPYNLFNPTKKYVLNETAHVILVSAIAQSSYLLDYVSPKVGTNTEFSFEDHHYFNEDELIKIIDRFNKINNYNKLILTTEKDATRLLLHKNLFEKSNIDIYVMPIEVEFYQREEFINLLNNYLLDFKS